MKYRILRRWHAEWHVIARLLNTESWRRHKTIACVRCLAGESCAHVLDILEKSKHEADIRNHDHR